MCLHTDNSENSIINGNNVCGKWIRYVRMGYYDKSHPELSQDDLVARLQTMGCSISRPSLSRIENGIRKLSDVEVLFFSKALKVPVRFLYEGTDNKMPDIEDLFLTAAEDPDDGTDED